MNRKFWFTTIFMIAVITSTSAYHDPLDDKLIAEGWRVWYEERSDGVYRCAEAPPLKFAGVRICGAWTPPTTTPKQTTTTLRQTATTSISPTTTLKSGCVRQDGFCDTKSGENCANCPQDCECYDLKCAPGRVGATSWGCFDPCADVNNGYYDKNRDACECKQGYAWNEAKTDCVSTDVCHETMHLADGVCVCVSGYMDCDGRESNGCEKHVLDDSRNCGDCGVECRENEYCRRGKCECKPGYIDKDEGTGLLCEKPGCNDNGVCEPEHNEDCRNCLDCRCSSGEMCNPFVKSSLTDTKGCRDCDNFCRIAMPNYVSYGSNGIECDCGCAQGYHWDYDERKCTNAELDYEKTVQNVRDRKPIGSCEFIHYIKKLEENNPDKKWQHFASQLHHAEYGYDTTYPLMGITLFIDGKENEGFRDIALPGGTSPKFVVDKYGQKIDVAHSYAGIRASINRGSTSWLMAKVNTDWGDLVQVAGGKITGSYNKVAGETGMLFNDMWGDNKAWNEYRTQARTGESQSASAWGYRPIDQVHGNQVGMDVRSILLKEPDIKLSDAYKKYFKEKGEDCP
ncbi:MAG TPA: hypothetical protein ENN13_03435 [Candidatus Altiarchaeales archaeon]|nr:hypothetical protein [Candidatus Altiarchaeales archaeon]